MLGATGLGNCRWGDGSGLGEGSWDIAWDFGLGDLISAEQRGNHLPHSEHSASISTTECAFTPWYSPHTASSACVPTPACHPRPSTDIYSLAALWEPSSCMAVWGLALAPLPGVGSLTSRPCPQGLPRYTRPPCLISCPFQLL